MLLFLDTSVEHIVALLALAKLNLTAVPLDPAYPQAVLRQVLVQSGADRLLFSESTRAALEQLGEHGIASHRVDLDAPARVFTRTPHQGERPLYMLFTSGSTGTPKGVQVSDRTLCNLLHWQRGAGGLAARAQTLQFSMLSFDVSFQEIFSTLCGGGCYHLIVPAWRQDAPALLEYLLAADIERLFMEPGHLPDASARGDHRRRATVVYRHLAQLVCRHAPGEPVQSLWADRNPRGLRFAPGGRGTRLAAACIDRPGGEQCLPAPGGRT